MLSYTLTQLRPTNTEDLLGQGDTPSGPYPGI